MTSYQSRLGGEEDVAEELAASQRSISIAEFFEKNKHMLGFDSGARALVTAVKEGVDNSLDACEEAGILPDIYIEIQEDTDYYRLIIEDNGPGITKEQIPKIFGKLLYGSRFHRREQSLTPDQTLLIKRNGTVECQSIGTLCDAYLPASRAATREIPDEIEVPSFNRETHELTWQPVTHAIRHDTAGETYRITTANGRTVELTDDHSLFTLGPDGETRELKASEVDSGDLLLAPQSIPTPADPVREVNLLTHLDHGQREDLYIEGFDQERLEQLTQGKRVSKRPAPDSDRERTYYRYDGVDIPEQRLEQEYIPERYLPADIVLALGWEQQAADCSVRIDTEDGQSTIPVSLSVDPELMRSIGSYLAQRDSGSDPALRVASASGEIRENQRERTATGEVTDSPLSVFLGAVCGRQPETRRIPSFVFETESRLQQELLASLYQTDRADADPETELSCMTRSETLARQLSVLWSMQGVIASTDLGGETDERYRTTVSGEDVAALVDSDQERTAREIPVSLLEENQIRPVDRETVPDTVPGLLLAAGVGSTLEQATTYQSIIEDAVTGAGIDPSPAVTDLEEMGLLDDQRRPTERLETLWERVQNLQGFTESDICLLPVERVQPTEPPEYVYDISVPGMTGYDENFVVANEGPLAVKNSRGQQGIGISAAVLYSQLTSGKPAKITSCTQGRQEAEYFEVIVDTDENEPEISVEETTTWDRPHGTRIELELEANMRARQQLHDYVKHTAVVNPHARIELREPDAQFKFERATDQLPADTEEIRPHPHGVELGTLIKMAESTDSYSISGFLQEEFTRVGSKTADNIIDGFRDRYFGREMSWRPPGADGETDLEATIVDAVANKGAQATAEFAQTVTERVTESERIAHHELVSIVDEIADEIQVSYGTTFGSTVRENAVEAAWRAITEHREPDLYQLVDEATTTRKDDTVVSALAQRLAPKFEVGDRHRLTRSALSEYVDRGAEMTEEHDDATFGETARENVVEILWERASRVPEEPPRISDVAQNRDTASDLLDAMRETDIISPPTDCLAPITAELLEAGLRKEYDADFYAASTRDASVHGGDPFIVEAGIAYGGEIETSAVSVLRFANRVPLVYQRGACATTDVVKEINWRNYGLDQPGGTGIPNGPAVLMVHVASTNVPFTSESKDAIANIPEIEKEIELAIREAARELKSYLNKRRSRQQRREKQEKLATILPAMAEKLAGVTGREPLQIDDTMARIMNDVLVTRNREGERVELLVENNTDTVTAIEATEIVTEKPAETDGATVVEMDGEWFLKWNPTVDSDDRATLEYTVDPAADCELSVDGIDDEKLTIDT